MWGEGYIGFGLGDSIMEVVSQLVSFCSEFDEFVFHLLEITELVFVCVFLAFFALSFPVEFELFGSDIFLGKTGVTFLLMISSMRLLFFFSFSL